MSLVNVETPLMHGSAQPIVEGHEYWVGAVKVSAKYNLAATLSALKALINCRATVKKAYS